LKIIFRIIASVLIALGIFWATQELILAKNVKDVSGITMYSGTLLKVDCKYIKSKEISYYILHTIEYDLLKFDVPLHKCVKSLLVSSSVRKFDAYFIGGLAMEVKVDSYTLVNFEDIKGEHNTIFIAIIILMILALVYVQLLFIGKIPLK